MTGTTYYGNGFVTNGRLVSYGNRLPLSPPKTWTPENNKPLEHLPATLPVASDVKLRDMGYQQVKGVWYRANKVTPDEISKGIVCEHVDISDDEQTCDWTGSPLEGAYLESLEGCPYTIAEDALDEWQAAMADTSTRWMRVLRKVTSLKKRSA